MRYRQNGRICGASLFFSFIVTVLIVVAGCAGVGEPAPPEALFRHYVISFTNRTTRTLYVSVLGFIGSHKIDPEETNDVKVAIPLSAKVVLFKVEEFGFGISGSDTLRILEENHSEPTAYLANQTSVPLCVNMTAEGMQFDQEIEPKMALMAPLLIPEKVSEARLEVREKGGASPSEVRTCRDRIFRRTGGKWIDSTLRAEAGAPRP